MFKLIFSLALMILFSYLIINSIHDLIKAHDNLEKAKAQDAAMIAERTAQGCTIKYETDDYIAWTCPPGVR
jgi:uncharacterized membrane protein